MTKPNYATVETAPPIEEFDASKKSLATGAATFLVLIYFFLYSINQL